MNTSSGEEHFYFINVVAGCRTEFKFFIFFIAVYPICKPHFTVGILDYSMFIVEQYRQMHFKMYFFYKMLFPVVEI